MRGIFHTLILVMGLVFAAQLLNAWGTCDVHAFFRWGREARESGYVAGYRGGTKLYPPLTALVNGVAVRWLQVGVRDDHAAVKRSIGLALVVGVGVVLVWTRRIWVAALFIWGMMLEGAAHGYTDAYYVPFLMVAVWAVARGRLVVFSVCYTVACLFKQLPLVLGPVLMVYAVKAGGGVLDWSIKVVLPALVILLVVFSVYGPEAFETPFVRAIDECLSGNCLNANWVYAWYARAVEPKLWGGLNDGSDARFPAGGVRIVRARRWAGQSWGMPLSLFWVFYAGAMVAAVVRDRSDRDVLLCAFLGYLSYVMFAPGVHENHWVNAVWLAVLLIWTGREFLWPGLCVIVMGNLNLLAFYGLDGSPTDQTISRPLFGLDLSAVLAAVFVVCFVAVYAYCLRAKRTSWALYCGVARQTLE